MDRLDPTSTALPSTRRLWWRPLALCLPVLMAAGSPAQAKPPLRSHVPSDEACDAATPEAPELVAVREMLLKPGQKFTLASIPKEMLARIPDFQKAEAERAKKDWPHLCKYLSKNRAVLESGKRPEVVFLGDSITENWEPADPAFFTAKVVDRGISGQTTAQMLLRVYPDVVALHPRVVHIMAGTNDVAGNTGPVSDDTIVDNIRAMIDIARANKIKVILASVPPASTFFWTPTARPAARIAGLNSRLRSLAAERGAVWVDYHAKLKDGAGGLPDGLANDGVHPNRDGYSVMRPLAEEAIRRARR